MPYDNRYNRYNLEAKEEVSYFISPFFSQGSAMNIVNDFRAHLFTEKSKPSKVTVKNYVSDVRKFVQWFEGSHNTLFTPTALSTDIIKTYQESLQKSGDGSVIAARSAKRYISSLRKFCRFLSDSGAIEANPFDALVVAPKIPEDPWEMKTFRNFLINQGSSKLTIKNYMLDIQQFLSWFEKVVEVTGMSKTARMQRIDYIALEQYRDRLLQEGRFSPTSINRKLSSLRRYARWLSDQGYIEKKHEPVVQEKETPVVIAAPNTVIEMEEEPIPLTALRDLKLDAANEVPGQYSRFAPFRLAQKTKKAINKSFDVLVFNPITDSVEAIQYTIWKKSGRKVFTPIKTFFNLPEEKLQVKQESAFLAKSTDTINRITTKTASIVGEMLSVKAEIKPYTVRNISKSFYAPLSISLTHLTWQQRLMHHLRFTRPAWYRKYHSWPIAHHIHFGILMFSIAVGGIACYQIATEQPGTNTAALASQPVAPPRTLAFQGRLLDKTNTPITAETKLRFAIYNSATGKGSLWEEIQEITPNQDGYFSTLLGKRSSLSQHLFTNNPNLYVGITVGTNAELQPRQQLATGGLAANAQALQGLKPITDTDETQNVILALDSSGDLTIGGSASPTFQATGGTFTLSGQTLILTTNPGSNGNVQLTADGSGIIDMQSALQNTTNNKSVTGVLGAVEVADMLAIQTSSSSQSALTVKQNSTGDIISGFNNEIAKFRVDASGNGMFAGNLQINGNTIATNANTFGIANTNVVNLVIGNSTSALALGGKTGITTINNNLDVRGTSTLNGPVSATGLITANGGLTIAAGQKFTLTDFTPGAIPFIGADKQIIQDAANFNWDTTTKSFRVTGAICVKATAGACAGTAAGTIYASNATVQAADLAENYISAQQLEPGDIVIPESLGNSLAIVKSTAAYQPQVIGIVSTKPGFTLNSDAKGDAEHPNIYPLALQGRVPVKVTTENGPIKAGDPLTSSSIPGVAMKATQPGQIIAKALEDYSNTDPHAIGKVMSFVNISYQIPQSMVTTTGDLNLAVNAGVPTVAQEGRTLADTTTIASANGIIDSIKSSVIEAKEISTQTLNVATNNVFVNGIHLDDYIASIVQEITGTNYNNTRSTTAIVNSIDLDASGSASLIVMEPEAKPTATIAAITAPVASNSAESIDAESEIASTAAAIDTLITNLATPSAAPTQAPSPTPTVTLPTLAPVNTASQEANLQGEVEALISGEGNTNLMETLAAPKDLGLETIDTKDATVSSSLAVLGRTTLSDVGITGKMTIGLMSIDGLNNSGVASINTSSGPLKFQSDGFNGVDFMNGKVAIDPKGNLEVNGNAVFAKNVTVKGKLAANVIAPVPGSDLTVENDKGDDVLKVSQKGDVVASGSGKFANINIVRGAQADTSVTETNANGSAGKGIIKAKQKERTIYTPFVTRQSLIYVTATSDTQKMTPYVARQKAQEDGKGSFTVQIPNNVSKDITFNWWIVN
jgi:site-specific recombinase XerD